MGFFKPAWMTDNESKAQRAIAAVERLTDQVKLKEAALSAPLWQVARVAASRLENETDLTEVAFNAEHPITRAAATRKIHDEETLASIYEQCSDRNLDDWNVRLAVAENAQDERLLEDFVKSCPLNMAQSGKQILWKITSPEALQRIAESFAVASIRDLARDRLREMEQRRAEQRRNEAARQVAAISDPAELVSIAEDESAEMILRKAAAEAITDQAILRRWAIECRHTSFLSMLDRISDPADVAEVARLAKDWKTQVAATEMVDDHATLEDMARGHWGDWRQAAKRLGGYGCVSCKTIVLPDDDAPVPCICPICGAENHDWEFVNGEIVHRDYSSGMSYDCCTRCGKKKNFIDHNTW